MKNKKFIIFPLLLSLFSGSLVSPVKAETSEEKQEITSVQLSYQTKQEIKIFENAFDTDGTEEFVLSFLNQENPTLNILPNVAYTNDVSDLCNYTYLYFKLQTYMLHYAYSYNDMYEIQEGSFTDYIRCMLDHLMPMKDCYNDFIDAVLAEDFNCAIKDLSSMYSSIYEIFYETFAGLESDNELKDYFDGFVTYFVNKNDGSDIEHNPYNFYKSILISLFEREDLSAEKITEYYDSFLADHIIYDGNLYSTLCDNLLEEIYQEYYVPQSCTLSQWDVKSIDEKFLFIQEHNEDVSYYEGEFWDMTEIFQIEGCADKYNVYLTTYALMDLVSNLWGNNLVLDQQIKCLINNGGPLCYKILDLFEAILAEDTPNINILVHECYDDAVKLSDLTYETADMNIKREFKLAGFTKKVNEEHSDDKCVCALNSIIEQTYTKNVGDVDSFLEAQIENIDEHVEIKSTVTKEATCTETGVKTFSCTGCTYSYTETIPALGHDYTNTVVNPTCTEQGHTLHECNDCDHSYIDTYVDALGHTFEETTYEWDDDMCTATRVCSECDLEETETVRGTYIKDSDGTFKNNELGHYKVEFISTWAESQSTARNSVEKPDSKIKINGTFIFMIILASIELLALIGLGTYLLIKRRKAE